MGLERLACILQGVDNIFEVDTVQNIMKKISDIPGANIMRTRKRTCLCASLPTMCAPPPL